MMPRTRKPYLERIAKQPGRDGCWLWTGAKYWDGYGSVCIKSATTKSGLTTRRAHRVIWEMENGPIPKDAILCHRCDVPACVRPSHLFLGNQETNMNDAKAKRRFRYGEGHWAAQLTAAKVRHARSLRDQGWIVREIAEKVGVSPKAVSAALTGRTWRHVA